MIEGVGIMLTRMTAPPAAPAPMMEMPGPSPATGKPMGVELPAGAVPPPMQEPEAAPAQPGWFAGWFGGGKKEEEQQQRRPQDLTEDKFAPPPMPDFGGGVEPQFR